MNATMPFDGNSTEQTMMQWLTSRLDRLERLIDENNNAINARINQIEHHLLLSPKVELDGWRAVSLAVSIVVAVLAIAVLIYAGGSLGN